MLTLDNVFYRYSEDARPAIDGLSFALSRGEMVAVMGANGSGKSTLAHLIAGILLPTQGRLHVPATTDNDLSVALVFQNPDNQIVGATVERDIAFALENLAVAADRMRSRVTDAMRRFEIHSLRSRQTMDLSGGEKQRLTLASATIQPPSILVLDEPDSYLDRAGRRLLDDLIADIRKNNQAMRIIRITQNPKVALACERLLVLERGKLVADRVPQKVMADADLCLKAGLRGQSSGRSKLIMPDSLLTGKSRAKSKWEIIAARRISFAYADRDALFRQFDFQLKAGEVVGLVGPTGSGKTTLGLLLCSLISPTSGTIEYCLADGTAKADVKPSPMAGIFQQPERQFFLPTVGEEVAFGPRNLGHKLSADEISRFLSMVGLFPPEFIARDPFSLSVGEKRRLAFAVVLAMYPSFVLFDEPTAGLDGEGVDRFIAIATELKTRGTGLLIISHDLDVLSQLVDRVLCLQTGRRPRELSVKEFLGDGEKTPSAPVSRDY
ncbi:MAG: ABC transporter ATP-binding protein [Candidatus Zixiibacteriota bacterium]